MDRLALKQRIRNLLAHLNKGLVQREDHLRLALLAALTGEHVLLLGPPGTAKSVVARRLCAAVKGGVYFETLLDPYTTPEQLFGPLSVKGLEQDRYERKTASYLPEAHVAFIDEVFKASPAILNTLLTLINERLYKNGAEVVRVPLACVVGASNEIPQGDALSAFYDRFLVRLEVEPVADDQFVNLLAQDDVQVEALPAELAFTPEELAEIRAASDAVRVSEDVRTLLGWTRTHLKEHQIVLSDRRWRKIQDLLQAIAYTDGRDEVAFWDLLPIERCLWEQRGQGELIANWFSTLFAGKGQEKKLEEDARLATAFEQQLAADVARYEQARDEYGRPLYLAPDSMPTTYASMNGVHCSPVWTRARFPDEVIQSRVGDVTKQIEDTRAVASLFRAIREQLESVGPDHLWLGLGDEAIPTIRTRLISLEQEWEKLQGRFQALAEGFQGLARVLPPGTWRTPGAISNRMIPLPSAGGGLQAQWAPVLGSD